MFSSAFFIRLLFRILIGYCVICDRNHFDFRLSTTNWKLLSFLNYVSRFNSLVGDQKSVISIKFTKSCLLLPLYTNVCISKCLLIASNVRSCDQTRAIFPDIFSSEARLFKKFLLAKFNLNRGGKCVHFVTHSLKCCFICMSA